MSDLVQRRRPALRDMEAFMELEGRDATARVLSASVPWRQYQQSGLLSAEELGLMLDYDKQAAEERADLLAEQGAAYAALFVKVLRDVAAEETVQYVLALVDELLRADRSRARFFFALGEGGAVAPYAPLLGILLRHGYVQHEYTVSKACQVLAALLGWPGVAPDAPELLDFVGWCVGRVDASKGAELLVVVSALKTLLRAPHTQAAFVRQCGGYRALAAMLRKEQLGSQLVYVSVFCVWLLTFNEELLQDLHDGDVVQRLVEVLKGAPREKVVRVCFAALENLLDRASFNECMAVSDLPRLLPTLLQRKLEDSELRQSIERVDETLKVFVRQLSSHDKYVAELETGSLHWSPVHNEKFWRKHVGSFEENNFSHIKKLLALLESDDDLTLEVACYDVGEFARFHPDGRRFVDKSGAKPRLMALLSHGNPKVAKMALLTVQKLMVQHWESLASATSRR